MSKSISKRLYNQRIRLVMMLMSNLFGHVYKMPNIKNLEILAKQFVTENFCSNNSDLKSEIIDFSFRYIEDEKVLSIRTILRLSDTYSGDLIVRQNFGQYNRNRTVIKFRYTDKPKFEEISNCASAEPTNFDGNMDLALVGMTYSLKSRLGISDWRNNHDGRKV